MHKINLQNVKVITRIFKGILQTLGESLNMGAIFYIFIKQLKYYANKTNLILYHHQVILLTYLMAKIK